MANIIEIKDFNTPELDIYARLSEAQLLHYYEPNGGLFIAESPKVIERALDAGYIPMSLLLEPKHITGEAAHIIARCGDIPVYTAELEVLTQLTGFQLTRGVLCVMHRKELASVESICRSARRIAILEDVMNPTNVGAIFRSAAALNMDAVLLTPACSNPLYRRASRVSMGTVFQIPWTYINAQTLPNDTTISNPNSPGKEISIWPQTGLEYLHKLGFKTAAMALSDDSVSIDDQRLHAEEKLAIILGTEGDGLATSTIADCDYTVKIPMSHNVDSLNVAAASAVAFWELGR
ncbi:MAG: RNA methyltransferase [Roseburia sp.]|nr:RNA methyltransferase [Roseburia sp.]